MSILSDWNTRGIRYDTNEIIASHDDLGYLTNEKLASPQKEVDPDLPFTVALRLVNPRRHFPVGLRAEYGCFDVDGSVIQDFKLNLNRQRRNILYYRIRDSFNASRGQNPDSINLTEDDPVPQSPEKRWAMLLTHDCPHGDEVERIFSPLVKLRKGKVIKTPKLGVPEFLAWIENSKKELIKTPYVMVCDNFENIPIEYQYLLNAFLVTGRMWFNNFLYFEQYVKKLLLVEEGNMQQGNKCFVASPVDDKVTRSDYHDIINPILISSTATTLSLGELIDSNSNFNKTSLLQTANDSKFLALYCHGLCFKEEDLNNNLERQGALVLKDGKRGDDYLLTRYDVEENLFVPGGIVFSPACYSGGTQHLSDFSHWIGSIKIPEYGTKKTFMSSMAESFLGSKNGPVGALLHFDVSASANMFNPINMQHDLQKFVHADFIERLLNGQTLGKATEKFRWVAGTFYAQAIHIFGQIDGWVPFLSLSKKRVTMRQMTTSMNQYHVIATDMRNYIIFGDPAVRLQ